MVLRRFGGIVLLLLGVVGIVVCGVAIYHTGSVKTQFRHFVGQVSDTTQNALGAIVTRLDQIDASLARVRADLKSVVSNAEALRTETNGGETPTDRIAFTLGHGVKEKLANAQQLVDSAENTAGAVGRLMTLLDAEGPDSGKTDEREVSLMKRIEGASGTLRRLPGMLERARQTALDLQNHPNSKQAFEKFTVEVGGMDGDLGEVQALIAEFKETIQEGENRLLHYQEQTIRWIRLGAILIPLLLVWLGAGQAALIILGGRLLKVKTN